MITVEIHEAKAQLSKLIARVVKGEVFVIAKAGTPLVKITAVDTPRPPQRLGFLAGEIAVPEDFNRMGQAEIAALFGGVPWSGNPTHRNVLSRTHRDSSLIPRIGLDIKPSTRRR